MINAGAGAIEVAFAVQTPTLTLGELAVSNPEGVVALGRGARKTSPRHKLVAQALVK